MKKDINFRILPSYFLILLVLAMVPVFGSCGGNSGSSSQASRLAVWEPSPVVTYISPGPE